ncbi:hypothetical protein DPMN_108231 [Dreissena polymorpha]|uniref:Neurotransmitter-gated ion-channel transmembrane domain-containing protein n=1 Tax=Dreissena polymorpha TaxID=45954 RepID=A0A9D4QKQ6_DREPO|nr:hypothetical protein DPMN_108231 [Dreissena polymorpha]
MADQSKGINMDYYETNSGWDIIDSSWSVDTETGDSTINFSIKLRRKPLYFMLSVIFPIIPIAILNLCAFLLPNECGERAGYAITVFLAFAVFLTIVSSSLPQNSESVSLIAIFLVIQTTCITLITILVLSLLRLGSFDEKDEKIAVPRVLTFLMQKLKWLSRSKCSKVETEKDGKMHDSQSSLPDASDSKVSRIEMPTQLHENRLFKESSTVDEFSWKEVVVFLDVVLFVIFAIILTASLLGCLVGAQRNAVN